MIKSYFTFQRNIQDAGDTFKRKHKISRCAGIHIRQGDQNQHAYLKLPSIVQFQKAMDFVRKESPGVKFIVCSDDYKWVQAQSVFQGDDVVLAQQSFEVDMYLISSCAKVIISRGTFGWWAGFLSGEIIYYDEHDMSHTINKNKVSASDYYPPNSRRMG